MRPPWRRSPIGHGSRRATAYRYFDSASDVVWQVYVDRRLPSVEDTLHGTDGDVLDRVLRAERVINGYLFDDADGARNFERAMLERTLRGSAAPDDRPARRLAYIDAALEPLADRLEPADLERTRMALALTMGSQVVPALLDTCKVDATTAREATRFAVRAIVSEALSRATAPVGAAGARAARDGGT
ncbi:MAG: hypothetical protein U5R31_03450 [Acidimicrobiia bacterium]|nr:hypothetical protein [Acidimicrobiia bacterium]